MGHYCFDRFGQLDARGERRLYHAFPHLSQSGNSRVRLDRPFGWRPSRQYSLWPIGECLCTSIPFHMRLWHICSFQFRCLLTYMQFYVLRSILPAINPCIRACMHAYMHAAACMCTTIDPYIVTHVSMHPSVHNVVSAYVPEQRQFEAHVGCQIAIISHTVIQPHCIHRRYLICSLFLQLYISERLL